MAENDPPRDVAIDYDSEADANGDDDNVFLDDAPLEALSNPPESHKLFAHQYDSLEELEGDLQEFAASAGFCVTRLRSANPVANFGPSYVSYACQRGTIRPSKAVSRSTSTTKMDCPWQATAKALKRNDRKWTFEVMADCSHHENHAGDGFNSRPRLSTEHKAFIATFTDRIGISNREVATSLRSQFPDVIFTMRQIRNYRYHLRKQAMAGYTPFQATMKLLEDEGVSYTAKWAEGSGTSSEDENRKPEGLFWTYDWCKKQWAENHWVQMYDNTYKTNNKGLALFQIVGLNHLGMAFSCGFGLINNERQEGFDWLMAQVDSIRTLIGARPPVVTITDYDKAMRAAVAERYPLAKPQICVFHLNKNGALNIKRLWDKAAASAVAAAMGLKPPPSQEEQEKDLDSVLDHQDETIVDRGNRPLDEEPGAPPEALEYSMRGIYKLWEGVVYAPTIEEHTGAWTRLKDFFPQQTKIIAYFESTWFPVVEQWAGCYINKNLNFGQRTTSPVESVNRYLKSFVMNGYSTVLEVVRQSCRMVEAMERRIREATLKERNTLKRDYIGQVWLGKTPYNVSAKAMELVTRQWRIALGAIPTKSHPTRPALGPCTDQFTKQYGVICSHDLLARHNAKKLPILREDFHPY